MIKNINKLLIVEDDKDVLEIMKECFEDYIEHIQVANDGQEGLEIYKKFRPDLILTDVTMPHMNGLTMAKEILQLQKDQKIIICTAHSESHYLKLAQEIGIKYILKKPINIDLLMNYIKE